MKESLSEHGVSHLGAVLRRSQSLPQFMKLQELDNQDFETTQVFFEDLTALLRSGELNPLLKLYEAIPISYVEAMTGEVLSKVLAYREGIEGKTLHLPVHLEGEWRQIPYHVESWWIDGKLPMMLLKSSQPRTPSWIVPRGTSPFFGLRKGTIESIEADLQNQDGIDVELLEREEHLGEVIEGLCEEGRSLCVAGHSLGGVMAVHLGVKVAMNTPRVYAYNAPGAGPITKGLYDSLTDRPAIFQFMTDGDLIPCVGRFLLGKVFAVDIHRLLLPVGAHLELTLNRDHALREVAAEEEERTLAREFMEGWVRAKLLRNLLKPVSYVSQTRLVRQWLRMETTSNAIEDQGDRDD